MHLSLLYDVYVQENLLDFLSYIEKLDINTAENNTSLHCIDIYSGQRNSKYITIYEEINEAICSIVENIYYQKIDKLSNGIVRYSKDQNIGLHRDWEPEDNYVVKNNKPKVNLSSVYYFNDNYVGGEICFQKQKESDTYLTYKPIKNSLIIFDSELYHYTKPIISGSKFSLTSFYTLEQK